ncbi:hypothetical protein ACFLS1_11240 [Verrucomicrobiota bacterium]
MTKDRKRTILIVVTRAIAGFVIIVVPIVFIQGYLISTERRVLNADHAAVLQACREMIAHRNEYSSVQPDRPTNQVYIDFTLKPLDPKIPKIIRDLKPKYVLIKPSLVIVGFIGDFNRLAYVGFPEGVGGNGNRKLIDGLWLISNMEDGIMGDQIAPRQQRKKKMVFRIWYYLVERYGLKKVTIIYHVLSVVILLFLPLGFAVRCIGSVCSLRLRTKIKQHPILHVGWFIASLLMLYVCWLLLSNLVKILDKALEG